MMVVVPPAAAARLPLSKSSQNTEPSAVSWSKWTWASMPPGTAIRPVASISFLPFVQPLAQRHDPAGRDADIAFHHVCGGRDGGVADDEIILGHVVLPGRP